MTVPGLRLALMPLLGAEVPLMAFLLAVMWSAWHAGRGPALAATRFASQTDWLLPPTVDR